MNHETLMAQGPVECRVRLCRDCKHHMPEPRSEWNHDCDGCKAQKREALKTRKALKRLSDTVLVFLHRLDEKVGPDKSIPGETGRLLAAWANDLDMVNDGARYNILGVDFRKDDKTKAVQKLMRPNA